MIPNLLFLVLIAFYSQEVFAASDKILCYYESWALDRTGNGKYTPEDIDPNLCTHIFYAFVGLNSDGTLQLMDEEVDVNQEGLKRVSALKAINPSLKTILSVGGAVFEPSLFETIAGDPEKLTTMAQSAIEFFETYNYDGLDIDWEYPYNKPSLVTLLTGLKEAFEPQGYLLTAAVNSIPDEVGGYDIPAMSELLDFINVMTYDFHDYWEGTTAENSPLYGGDDEDDWQKENRNADAAIRQWIDGGADPQKIAVGVAFYGHSFVLSDPAKHGLGDATVGPAEPGVYTGDLGGLGYNEICEFHPNGTVVFLEDMKVPYLYEDKLWVGYDNEESVAYKARYAKEINLAGVFIWSIDTDDLHGFCGETNGLLKKINHEILVN